MPRGLGRISKNLMDRLLYYYSHLVVARGCGSLLRCVQVVLDQNLKECEVKYKYHRNIVKNKYENPMMLLLWNLYAKDLFNIGIYCFFQTKIYFTVGISMYVKPSVPAFMQLKLLWVTLNGCQMAAIACKRSIDFITRETFWEADHWNWRFSAVTVGIWKPPHPVYKWTGNHIYCSLKK